MAESSKKGEEPNAKSKKEKSKMTGKETKGVRPDQSKKILLMEADKILDPNAPDTYNEIDIDMEDVDGVYWINIVGHLVHHNLCTSDVILI